jgi:hypothetical protein
LNDAVVRDPESAVLNVLSSGSVVISSLMWLRPRVAACALEIVRLREVADMFDYGHQDSARVSSSGQFSASQPLQLCEIDSTVSV